MTMSLRPIQSCCFTEFVIHFVTKEDRGQSAYRKVTGDLKAKAIIYLVQKSSCKLILESISIYKYNTI